MKSVYRGPLLLTGLFILFLMGVTAVFQPAWLEQLLSGIEMSYADVLEQRFSSGDVNPLLLPLFAFIGGVLGSISPCILAMLPMNLAYIGTQKVSNRRDAFKKAGAFVAGVVLVTSLFGLLSGFASVVMIEYKGYFYVAIAAFILAMAASMLGWVRVALPQGVRRVPNAGPFVVGTAFALISSPCASPVLFGVLALAATSSHWSVSVITMAAYGLGYTALIFLASVFAGLSKQLNFLKYHGDRINQISGGILFLAGLWSLYTGGEWFLQGS